MLVDISVPNKGVAFTFWFLCTGRDAHEYTGSCKVWFSKAKPCGAPSVWALEAENKRRGDL